MTVIHDLASRDSIWKMQERRCALLGNEIPRESSFLISHEDESKVYGWMGALAVEPEVRTEIQSSEYAEIMAWIRFSPEPKCSDVLDTEPGENWGAREKEEAQLFAKHWRVVLPAAAWIVLTNPRETLDWRGYAYVLLSNLLHYASKHPVQTSSRKNRFMWSPGAQWQKLRQKRPGVDLQDHQILGFMVNGVGSPANHNMFVMNNDNYNLVRNALEEDVTSALFDGSRWWNALAAPFDLEMPPFRDYGDVTTLLKMAKGEPESADQESWPRRAAHCWGALHMMCLAHQMDSELSRAWAAYPAFGAVVAAGAPRGEYAAIARTLDLQDVNAAEVNRWVDILSAPTGKVK